MEHHHLVIEGSNVLIMVSLLVVDLSNHLLTSSVDSVLYVGLTLLNRRFHSLHTLLNDSLNVLLKSF